MKVKFLQFVLFFTIVMLIASANAQVINGGFENWTAGNPDGWVTDNIVGLASPVTQSSDAHSGSSAVMLSILSIAGQPYPAYMYTIGNSTLNFRAGSLTGYYKLNNSSGNDILYINILMVKDSSYIGSGYAEITASQSAYTQFSIPITYATGDVPDNAYITMALDDSSGTPVAGATALVDDLTFGNATGVNDETNSPLTFKMEQNYPNPFNPSTKIQYTIPRASVVTLRVYNILGSQVKELVNNRQPAGTHNITFDAANLPSGIYIAKLTAGNYTKTIKMTLLK